MDTRQQSVTQEASVTPCPLPEAVIPKAILIPPRDSRVGALLGVEALDLVCGCGHKDGSGPDRCGDGVRGWRMLDSEECALPDNGVVKLRAGAGSARVRGAPVRRVQGGVQAQRDLVDSAGCNGDDKRS